MKAIFEHLKEILQVSNEDIVSIFVAGMVTIIIGLLLAKSVHFPDWP